MTTLRNVAAALFIFVLATAATAEARHAAHPTAQVAVNKSSRVQSLKDSVITDGYKLDSVQESPIYYIAPPKAPYNWGTIVYTFSRPGVTGAIDSVELTVQIQYTETGFAFPEITVRENAAE
jgi:hypothetical protein